MVFPQSIPVPIHIGDVKGYFSVNHEMLGNSFDHH